MIQYDITKEINVQKKKTKRKLAFWLEVLMNLLRAGLKTFFYVRADVFVIFGVCDRNNCTQWKKFCRVV